MSEIRQVHNIAHHRNGVWGAPFYVVTFTDTEGDAKIATVFDQEAHVAVLSMGRLAEGCIAFGENSWRGDLYEEELRAAIAAWEDERRFRDNDVEVTHDD